MLDFLTTVFSILSAQKKTLLKYKSGSLVKHLFKISHSVVPILSPPSSSRTSPANPKKPNLIVLKPQKGIHSFFTYHHLHDEVSNVSLQLAQILDASGSRSIPNNRLGQKHMTYRQLPRTDHPQGYKSLPQQFLFSLEHSVMSKDKVWLI